MKKEVLRMERVSCRRGERILLDGLSLNVFEGEILGLVPANSFGVEPLIQVLCHNLPLYYGYVYYGERLVNTWRHLSQIPSGIMLIQSRSSLVPDLTVLENVLVLGSQTRETLIPYRRLREEFDRLTQKFGLAVKADAYADNLTIYERVAAELMKAVHLRSKLVILWDVSTFVSAYELKKLHTLLRLCTEEGMSFLYITPHMEEAEGICQRTLWMYNGQVVKSFGNGREYPDYLPFYGNQRYLEMVRSQIGRLEDEQRIGEQVFEMNSVSSGALKELSFQVKQGECLVLQDLDGRFSEELLLILQKKCPYEGQIRIGGTEHYRDRQIAIVEELASSSMLFPQLSYMDNLCFTLDHRMPKIWRSDRLRRGLRRDLEPSLEPGVFEKTIPELTEKERQTLIYKRILLQRPDIVFCVRPFKGAEMEVRMHICQQVEDLLKAGIAVVILAVNLADSLALADRILQVRKGRAYRQYLPEEYSSLPISTPWRQLYADLGHSENDETIPQTPSFKKRRFI